MQYQTRASVIFSIIFLFACSASLPLLEPDKEELILPAPSVFTVEFITTKGNVLIEAKREYSPLAADRFYYLVKNNYYCENRFFRVVPKFVVQWGMKGIPGIDKLWDTLGIFDEPVKLSNTKGTIAFARSVQNSRSNQLFINLEDNTRLDTSTYNNVNGFPAFGKVIKGMGIIESINAEYKQLPNQDSIMVKGNSYLNNNFPNLDYIISTKIISE